MWVNRLRPLDLLKTRLQRLLSLPEIACERCCSQRYDKPETAKHLRTEVSSLYWKLDVLNIRKEMPEMTAGDKLAPCVENMEHIAQRKTTSLQLLDGISDSAEA